MKLTPLVEDLMDRILAKIKSKHNAAMKYVYDKKMERDPEFRRRMQSMDKSVKAMQDFVEKAKKNPEIMAIYNRNKNDPEYQANLDRRLARTRAYAKQQAEKERDD